LNEVAPFIVLENGDMPLNPASGLVWESKLPIWFGENASGGAKKKVICFLGDANPADRARVIRHSEADPFYDKMSEIPKGNRPDIKGSMSDFAILARITVGDFHRRTGENGESVVVEHGPRRKILIISGIHQYGTWIAGKFFADVVEGVRPRYADKILEPDDFACVIGGTFDRKT
jgi:hypothetical protein